MEANGDIDTPSVVSAACLKVVEEAFDGTKTSPLDVGVQLVAEAFNVVAVPAAVAIQDGQPSGMADSTSAAIQKEVARLLGVAAPAKTSGASKKKAAKAAAAALAATAAAEKAKGKGKGGFKLPVGTRCSKGTCDFNHDEHYPGEPCYRDPNWAGPLPAHVWANTATRARIIQDRETEGKRTGTAVKTLVPPAGAGAHAVVPQDAAGGAPPSLMEMCSNLGFMVSPCDACFDDENDDGGYGMQAASGLLETVSETGGDAPMDLPDVVDDAEAAGFLGALSPTAGITTAASLSILSPLAPVGQESSPLPALQAAVTPATPTLTTRQPTRPWRVPSLPRLLRLPRPLRRPRRPSG